MNKIEKVDVAANDILVITCEMAMPGDVLAELRDSMLRQKEEGVVMIPFGFSCKILRRDSAFVTMEGKP